MYWACLHWVVLNAALYARWLRRFAGTSFVLPWPKSLIPIFGVGRPGLNNIELFQVILICIHRSNKALGAEIWGEGEGEGGWALHGVGSGSTCDPRGSVGSAGIPTAALCERVTKRAA